MINNIEPVTHVVFRKWRGNSQDIVAIFPYQLGTYDPSTCGSYEHIGQHGSANPGHVIARTTPAKPHEYESLAIELTNLGYRLKIVSRIPKDAFAVRRNQC